ncbi:hypothetical protein GCM10011378_11180 [Hymenobacter glacieicola]|uniref:Uncharacterized protein n=1 Tax=Hymenobacter glacieicola TaxID=1562124 RepID=A0ABQ1WLC6_9BACT|nr:hypothetical protein GCM10011378_11180 [Hymenobacter glacieicola]
MAWADRLIFLLEGAVAPPFRWRPWVAQGRPTIFTLYAALFCYLVIACGYYRAGSGLLRLRIL